MILLIRLFGSHWRFTRWRFFQPIDHALIMIGTILIAAMIILRWAR